MASSMQPPILAVLHFTRTKAYAKAVEDRESRNPEETRKGGLYSAKSIPSNLASSDNE